MSVILYKYETTASVETESLLFNFGCAHLSGFALERPVPRQKPQLRVLVTVVTFIGVPRDE